MDGVFVFVGALLGSLLANGNLDYSFNRPEYEVKQSVQYQAPTIDEQIKYDDALAERESVLFMRDLDNKVVYNLVDK